MPSSLAALKFRNILWPLIPNGSGVSSYQVLSTETEVGMVCAPWGLHRRVTVSEDVVSSCCAEKKFLLSRPESLQP